MAVTYIEKEHISEICVLCVLELALLRKQVFRYQRENAKASAVFKNTNIIFPSLEACLYKEMNPK